MAHAATFALLRCQAPCEPGFIALFNYAFVFGIFGEIIFLLFRFLNNGIKNNNTTKKIKNRIRIIILFIIIISLIGIVLKNQTSELISEFIYLFL